MTGIVFDSVTWGPRGRCPVISGISMDVGPGEMLGIVGPNGAGKSSLLRCVYRYHRPTAGRILLDGLDIWTQSARRNAQRVAAVVQEPASDLPLTVAEVVELGRLPHDSPAYPVRGRTHPSVARALNDLDLADMATRGYATLSGGEKQRVQVARALTQEPRVLVLDEPTNHLDIRHQFDLLGRLAGLGITVLASLHDLNMAALFCDRIAILDRGRLTAHGPPGHVLNPGLIRSVFQVEADVVSLTADRPTLRFKPLQHHS